MNGVNGYILAGGKSSRMGKDKGLMLLEEKAIVQHVIDALQAEVDRITIVSNSKSYEKFGFEVIEDLIKDIGPAGGIFTVLNHSIADRNFIVSCDMPFITKEAIKFMIGNSSNFEITLPFHQQKLEPLFGVYAKVCLPKWSTLIESGNIKLHDMVAYFDLYKLNVDNNTLFDEKLFLNLNTKLDFENAIEHIKRKES